VLLTLARLHWAKGLDTLFKSLVALPGYWLWLAGDGELEQSLKELARTLGIADRVRFLGWRKDRAALLKADMLVVPSRFEAFGTVLLEGWSMQKPVVAAAWPHTVIENEKTGLLMPIDDVKGLNRHDQARVRGQSSRCPPRCQRLRRIRKQLESAG
jgi:glycosyltransferase involved in cell wall biosynthesis